MLFAKFSYCKDKFSQNLNKFGALKFKDNFLLIIDYNQMNKKKPSFFGFTMNENENSRINENKNEFIETSNNIYYIKLQVNLFFI